MLNKPAVMLTSTPDIFHILLAEDDADDSMLFSLAADLFDIPLRVSLAEDGEMLLRFLQNKIHPSIIFMDLNMPKKNGMECLMVIRASRDFDKIPVIIYSTSRNTKEIDTCYGFGANYYIIKPESFEGIVKVLKTVLAVDWNIKPTRKSFVIKG